MVWAAGRIFRLKRALLGWMIFAALAAAACGGKTTRHGADEEGAGTGGVPRPTSVGREEGPSVGCQAGAGLAAGIAFCARGYLNRAVAAGCELPPHDGGELSHVPAQEECREDAACAERENGYCTFDGFFGVCTYACVLDSDCQTGEICLCRSYRARRSGEPIAFGACVAAGCASNDSCESGALCIAPPMTRACDTSQSPSFHCQSPDDECSGDSDCTESGICSHDGERFVCSNAPDCTAP